MPCFLSLNLPGVLKDYLRELPYPLITKQLYEAVLESMAVRPLRMGASGCENDQADSEHTVGLLEILPEVERVRTLNSTIVTGRERRHRRGGERADCGADNNGGDAADYCCLASITWVVVEVCELAHTHGVTLSFSPVLEY